MADIRSRVQTALPFAIPGEGRGGDGVIERLEAWLDQARTDTNLIRGKNLLGGATPGCEKACDTNADGLLNIADSISGLSYLFSDGTAPPSPFGACGLDPTDDELSCADPTSAACP